MKAQSFSLFDHTHSCCKDMVGAVNRLRFRDDTARAMQAWETQHAALGAHSHEAGPHMWGLNLAEQPICCSRVVQ